MRGGVQRQFKEEEEDDDDDDENDENDVLRYKERRRSEKKSSRVVKSREYDYGLRTHILHLRVRRISDSFTKKAKA